ncbi:hypothetical protein HY625_00995 [Candidatus Uhrbacteria bacterium]|nr:hypothetical protein [Candidatus Uhrbacteria bacterium]
MKSFLRHYVLGMVALGIFVSPFFVVLHGAQADANFGLDTAAQQAGIKTDSVTKGSPEGVQSIIGELIATVLSFVGVIFLILIIYGGVLWMTAGGAEDRITKAKGIITNAVIGLALIFAAYAITAFVTGQLSGAFGI